MEHLVAIEAPRSMHPAGMLSCYRPQSVWCRGGVCPGVWADTPLQVSRHPLPGPPQVSRHPLPPQDGQCRGRYISYWNAFLFLSCFWFSCTFFGMCFRFGTVNNKNVGMCLWIKFIKFLFYSRVFRLEPDIAILYRFVLQNVKTKYYPTPSGNRTRGPLDSKSSMLPLP